MELTNNSRIFSNELIFILYFWRLVILKPITTTYLSYGMIFVLGYSFVLVALSVLLNTNNGFTIRVEPIGIVIFVIYCVFIFDYFVRPTSYVTDYMYELFLYGVLPAYFLLKVNNYQRFIKIFFISAVILFLVYFTDPINDFRFFDNYMTFGFQLAFPAFMGIDIGRTYYRRKWPIILEVLCIIELFVFANRSCIISVVLYFILKDLFVTKFDFSANMWRSIRRIAILIIALVIAMNWETIILGISDWLDAQGYSSYSLSQYVYYIENGSFMTGSEVGGRSGIWSEAMAMFSETPLIGEGSGSFIEQYGYYTHNIISDLLVQYGLIGFVFLGYYIIKAVKIFFVGTYTREYMIILLVMFCLWCPKLFFSTNFFNDMGLWCFLTVALSDRFKETDLYLSEQGDTF